MTPSGRADIHTHTHYSDGTPTVHELLAWAAARARLDVIAITDHDTIEGALQARELAPRYGIEVVAGEEITSREGHILGLFLHECVPPGLSGAETVAAIRAQGGLAIAAHPFLRATSHIDGVGSFRMGAGAALRRIPFDGVEAINSFPALAWANYQARRYNRRYCHLPELGGSDAHVKEVVGKAFTRFPGRTAADFAAAIRAGATSAGWSPYGPAQLRAYYAFWRRARNRSAPAKT